MERIPKPVQWLMCDKVNFWRSGKWQFRIERWGQRILVVPLLAIDWEIGMVSVVIGWLFCCVCLDYEFNPDYDKTQEIEYPVSRYPKEG